MQRIPLFYRPQTLYYGPFVQFDYADNEMKYQYIFSIIACMGVVSNI